MEKSFQKRQGVELSARKSRAESAPSVSEPERFTMRAQRIACSFGALADESPAALQRIGM